MIGPMTQMYPIHNENNYILRWDIYIDGEFVGSSDTFDEGQEKIKKMLNVIPYE